MSSGRITLDEVLDAVDRAGKVCEPVTASEVGEELGCTRRAALNKLDELAERGDLESKKVGARSRVWWRPPDAISTPERSDTDDDFEPGSITVEGSLDDIKKRLDAELDRVFRRISEGFYALDSRWRFTYVSERAEDLIDAQDMNLVGENIWEVFDDVADTKLEEEYREAMETQEPTFFELYDETLDAWYEVHAYPSETGLSVYFRDVTDRKQRERELERSERRYRALIEHFPNGAVALVDEDLTYRTVGGNPLDVADVTVEEVEGSPVREVLPSALADELAPRYEAAMEGESDSFEAEYDGRIFEFQVVPVRDDDGEVFAALGMSQDITERKERERQLQRYREYTDRILDAIDDVFYLLDESGNLQRWNDSLCEVTGYGDEEVEAMHALEFFGEDAQGEIADAVREGFETGHAQVEAEVLTKGGDRIPYEFVASALEDPDGNRVLAGIARDVTERREHQQRIEESERRYRTLVENFPNGSVGLFDEDLRYTAVGGQLVDALDISPEDRIGNRIPELHPDEVVEEIEPYFQSALQGEANSFEVEYRDRHLSAHTLPVKNADGEVDAGMLVVQDVTERREAQRELRKSEAKFRTLAENLEEIVWMATPDAEEFVYINPVFEEVWGLDRDALYDDPLAFLDAVHPDDRERVREAFTALPESDFDEAFRIVRPDGEERWVHARGTTVDTEDGALDRIVGTGEDVTERKERERELERALDLLDRTQRIADVGGWEIDVETQDVFWTDHVFELLEVPGDEEPPLDEALAMYHEADQPVVEDAVENALDSGESFDVEVRVRTEGGDTRWLRLQGVPETVDGDVVSFRGAAQDVTERVERERELEERNERLDSFASMLAHELRNPVTIGQIYSQQLPAEADADAVEYVAEAFDRIEDMIDVLLVLTRGREAVGERTPVDLAAVVREAWENVETLDATLDVEAGQTIQADETYVQHLFRNLFENAVEHGGADVTVRVGDLPTGFYVSDDGVGIPADERDAVFEAGYTTAAEQGGTGLGLAFVQKLADVYEWEYAVTESEDGGARFEFTNVV